MEQFGQFVTNHWVLFTALAVIMVMLINNLMGSIGAVGRAISSQRAVQLMNRDGAIVVDVREPKDFNAGHIVGAINLPEARIAERLKELEPHRNKPLLLCCATGMVAGRAGGVLKKHGYANLHVLKGGIAGWQQDNLPLTREKQT
jgi:rhodanese-related sulfurtransferase